MRHSTGDDLGITLGLAAALLGLLVGAVLLHSCTCKTPDKRAAAPATQRSMEQPSESDPDGAGGAPEDVKAAVLARGAAENLAFFQRGIDAFEAEPIDEVWAAEVAGLLEDRLNAHMADETFARIEIGPVECRTHTCALALRCSEDARLRKFNRVMRVIRMEMAKAGHHLGMSRASRPDPAGSGTLVRYHFTSARQARRTRKQR